jgi:hypothetical protein
LRRSRLDELPQLWNVLKGDMSLVGPRPERPEFVDELTRQIPFYRQRNIVRPGLTGWAQVRYTYGASVEDALQKLQYDLFYIKNLSLALDVFIILDTIKTVLPAQGSVAWAGKDDARDHHSGHLRLLPRPAPQALSWTVRLPRPHRKNDLPARSTTTGSPRMPSSTASRKRAARWRTSTTSSLRKATAENSNGCSKRTSRTHQLEYGASRLQCPYG